MNLVGNTMNVNACLDYNCCHLPILVRVAARVAVVDSDNFFQNTIVLVSVAPISVLNIQFNFSFVYVSGLTLINYFFE